MTNLEQTANIASACFALLAAGLWIYSAQVKTPYGFSIQVITSHCDDAQFPGSETIGQGFGTSPELNTLGQALIKQSRFSAGAAISAAIAAVLQVSVATGWLYEARTKDIIGMAAVTDGDTIEIHGTPIRLMGIDAPESGQSCETGDSVKYLCGQKASFVLADLLKDKTVTCHDSGQRSYKRVLAHCFVGALDIQREMVRLGWAIAYRRYSQE